MITLFNVCLVTLRQETWLTTVIRFYWPVWFSPLTPIEFLLYPGLELKTLRWNLNPVTDLITFKFVVISVQFIVTKPINHLLYSINYNFHSKENILHIVLNIVALCKKNQGLLFYWLLRFLIICSYRKLPNSESSNQDNITRPS